VTKLKAFYDYYQFAIHFNTQIAYFLLVYVLLTKCSLLANRLCLGSSLPIRNRHRTYRFEFTEQRQAVQRRFDPAHWKKRPNGIRLRLFLVNCLNEQHKNGSDPELGPAAGAFFLRSTNASQHRCLTTHWGLAGKPSKQRFPETKH